MSNCRSKRAAKALAYLPEVDPGLASLALWCDTQDGEAAQTVTSGDTIHIGRDFNDLPIQEQIGVLGHHILHIALRHEVHLLEMKDRFAAHYDAELHNLCADAIVNECLIRGGHALPRPAVLLRDLVAATLPDITDPGHDILATWDLDKLFFRLANMHLQDKEKCAEYMEHCRFEGDIVPKRPDLDALQSHAEWQAHLLRARNAGGASGRGVGASLRKLENLQKSQTPWEHHLRRALANAVIPQPRQTFRRPRSSWIARETQAVMSTRPRPAFEPAQPRQSMRPRIAVGIDTSGSVNTDILTIFASEVIGIMRKSGAETHLLCFDETVYSHQKLTAEMAHSALNAIDFRGDGGTSFVDVMEQARRLSPSVIIVLTDIIGTFGPAPETRVIWASPTSVTTPPPFGEVIEIIR